MKTTTLLFFVLGAILLAGCDPETIDPNLKETDGTFKDVRDQHVYKYINIGNQTWMAENLHYLPAVDSSGAGSDTLPLYYVFGYEGTSLHDAWLHVNFAFYGVLYNWPAAKTACPAGWHLPSDAEWTTLSDYLINKGYGFEGSGEDIGKSMAFTSGWLGSSEKGTIGYDMETNNSSGFAAVAGGARRGGYGFTALGASANFWSSSAYDATTISIRQLFFNSNGLYPNQYEASHGFSVRCAKNK